MMPISARTATDLRFLNNSYDRISRTSYKRWLFPQSIRQALNGFSQQGDIYPIVAAYLNTSSFQRRRFKCLQEFSQSHLIRSIEMARHEGLPLTPQNIHALAAHTDPMEVLRILNETGLLKNKKAQANFDVVVKHEYLYSLVAKLRILQREGLLSDEFAQINFESLVKHRYFLSMDTAIDYLLTNGLLGTKDAQVNFQAIAGHQQNPFYLAIALDTLNKEGLLTGDGAQANRDAIARHTKPRSVADALKRLNNAGLLTGEGADANRAVVMMHQDPESIALILQNLNNIGLLTGERAQANREAVAIYQDLHSLNLTLDFLNHSGLFAKEGAQANFESLIMYLPFLPKQTIKKLQCLPDDVLTPARFAAIMNLCKQRRKNAESDCEAYADYINEEILNLPSVRPRRFAQDWGVFAANRLPSTDSLQSDDERLLANHECSIS